MIAEDLVPYSISKKEHELIPIGTASDMSEHVDIFVLWVKGSLAVN